MPIAILNAVSIVWNILNHDYNHNDYQNQTSYYESGRFFWQLQFKNNLIPSTSTSAVL
jgi:hypothetical protein